METIAELERIFFKSIGIDYQIQIDAIILNTSFHMKSNYYYYYYYW